MSIQDELNRFLDEIKESYEEIGKPIDNFHDSLKLEAIQWLLTRILQKLNAIHVTSDGEVAVWDNSGSVQ